MGTVTPVYGWPIPSLPDVANGPEGFEELASAIEAAFTGPGSGKYVPRWASLGKYQPINPVKVAGYFRVAHGFCDIWAYMGFAASTSGGTGGLTVGLPVPASTDLGRQVLTCVILVPGGGTIDGQALITAGASEAILYVPLTFATLAGHLWRSADDTRAVATGIPNVAGNYTIRPGGTVTLQGRYRVRV